MSKGTRIRDNLGFCRDDWGPTPSQAAVGCADVPGMD